MPIKDSTYSLYSADTGADSDQNTWEKIGATVIGVLEKVFPFFKGETQHLSWEEANATALKTVQIYKDYIYSQYKPELINYGFTDLYRVMTADWIEACINGQRWSDHTSTDNYRFVASLRGIPYVNVTPTNWLALRGTSQGFETVMWLHCMWILENMDKNNPDEFPKTLTYDLRFKTLDPSLVKFGIKQASSPVVIPPPAPIEPVTTSPPASAGSSIVPEVLQGNIGIIAGIGILGALLYHWGKK